MAYLFMCDGEEHPVDHEAEEEKKHACRHTGQYDEWEGKLCSKVCHPNRVERILKVTGYTFLNGSL